MSQCQLWGFVPWSLVVYGLLLIALCEDVSSQSGSGSRHQRPKILKSLGTGTPYRDVANLDSSPVNFDGCHATRFWGLFRHGTRNPNERHIKRAIKKLLPLRDEIVENFYAGKGVLSESDVSLLKDWTLNLTEDDAYNLIDEGAKELLNLGKRFKSRFRELFSRSFDEGLYEVHHSTLIRTLYSATNFSMGAFGEEFKSKIKYQDPSESNSYLMFFNLCDKYLKCVKKSKDRSEEEQFKNGPEVRNVIESISDRLGLDETLSLDDVLVMYIFCGFNAALDESKPSAWCSPFTEDDLAVIEYLRELKPFTEHGYKYEITYKSACPLVKNAFGFFSSNDAGPSVKLNFSHSSTILSFLASLGLYKDSRPLLATNFRLNMNRKWKRSVIDTFASNLVFVLFDCGDEKKVLTLHQEKAITLPGCPETHPLCPLETILKTYSDPIENCNFEEMCTVNKGSCSDP